MKYKEMTFSVIIITYVTAAMFSGLLVDFLRGFSCVPSSGFGVSSTLDLKRTF